MRRIAGYLLGCIWGCALALGPDTAAAGFLPPSAWQSSGKASETVLAVRAAVETAMTDLEASGNRLETAERQALEAFYEARNFSALWLDGSDVTPAGKALAEALREAPSHALPASNYAFALEALNDVGPRAGLAEQARAELSLSAAALLYARHATAGVVVPKSLGKMTTIEPEAIDPGQFLDLIAGSGAPAEVLASLHPQSTDYADLRNAYAALIDEARSGAWTVVPDGETLKAGMNDARVPALRARLIESGELPPSETDASSTLYDDPLVEAVKAFQARNGLADDGTVGPNTYAALNMALNDRIRQVAVNLERRRWLPDELGSRHVFVNQADYRMQLIEDGASIHEARVIIGKTKHQTPVFSDVMDHVVLNPYWNVPRSISTEEYLPHLQANPLALSNMGIEMFVRQDGRSVQIDPTQVDWSQVNKSNFNFRFRQPPMQANALGRVKFMFPNEHHVYMHDTPSRSLFARQHRAFSHGCVRVQDPLKFAEILLEREGWWRTRIDKVVAGGENTRINLKHKVPVHLAYWTAWMGEDGRLNTRPDVYGRDEILLKALGLNANALKMAELDAN